MSFTKLSSSAFSSAWFTTIGGFALATTLVACVIEDSNHHRSLSDPPPPVATGVPAGSGTVGPAPAPTDPPTPSPAPILVVLDTDQVMNADPGQGVGIFTEYFTGGRWHVWWTCDTALSKQTCDVALSATVASGTIDNLDVGELSGGFATSPTPSRVEARATTSTEVHGITFTTAPGAIVTLEATVGGLREGPGTNHSFFFFVQDGKINGGFGGRLTNPLQLQGKTP
jgi:hypothetical protein